jgi:uncharacterized membrane protein
MIVSQREYGQLSPSWFQEHRSLVSLQGLLSRPIDFSPLRRWIRYRIEDRPIETLVWLGAFLRVWVYLDGRPYWMDEGSLHANLTGGPILDFSRPLVADQLAPFGFLIAERLLVALFGGSVYVTRLIPLACGIAALGLFRVLTERLLCRSGAIVAMILFAFSDDLVYYSSELKPYSLDLALGLVVTIVSLSELLGAPSRRRLGLLALIAIASPWMSFPSAFVVAGCGAVLLADRLIARRWRDAAWLASIAGAWAASTFVAYRASSRLLGEATSMYVFWNFAFLPFPPTTRKALSTASGILLETFVTPLNLSPPYLPWAFAGLAVVLLVLGTVALGRRDAAGLMILVAPLLLALAASALRKYPFHGRLIVWLVPVFFVLIAEGTQLVRARGGRAVYVAVLVLLLAYPCADALYESTGRRNRDFNIHGDLRKNQFME